MNSSFQKEVWNNFATCQFHIGHDGPLEAKCGVSSTLMSLSALARTSTNAHK